MKKLFALCLSALLLLSLFGCGEAEKEEKQPAYLPFGLKFGMSYDAAVKQHSGIPALKPADSNDGYFAGNESGGNSPTYEQIAEFFKEPDGLVCFLSPQLAYSFNENKELYELYIMDSPFSEGMAESQFNLIYNYYKELLGDPTGDYESSTELRYEWETKDVNAMVMLHAEGGNYLVMLTLHSNTYQLTD